MAARGSCTRSRRSSPSSASRMSRWSASPRDRTGMPDASGSSCRAGRPSRSNPAIRCSTSCSGCATRRIGSRSARIAPGERMRSAARRSTRSPASAPAASRPYCTILAPPEPWRAPGLPRSNASPASAKPWQKRFMTTSTATDKIPPVSRAACLERSVPLLSLPNLLTLSRILAIPVVVASFYVPGDYARWFACALFAAAGFTDWLDGHMARRWSQQSELGRFLDPIADKLLVAATLFMLTAFGRLSAEALLPALVILCREILVSGLREYLAGLRVGLPVSKLAKWKTVIQMVAIGVLIVGDAGPGFVPVAGIGESLLWIAAILTLVTGYDYLQAGLRHMARPRAAPTSRKSEHLA